MSSSPYLRQSVSIEERQWKGVRTYASRRSHETARAVSANNHPALPHPLPLSPLSRLLNLLRTPIFVVRDLDLAARSRPGTRTTVPAITTTPGAARGSEAPVHLPSDWRGNVQVRAAHPYLALLAAEALPAQLVLHRLVLGLLRGRETLQQL